MGLAKGKWITNLEYAFQDSSYLYLVMEYLAGGNLLSLMYKHDSFDEETARFYIAETILGVQEIHSYNFVYRYEIDTRKTNIKQTKTKKQKKQKQKNKKTKKQGKQRKRIRRRTHKT